MSAIIDRLDISEIEAGYKGGGTSSYNPRMLLKVIVYAYLNNVYSGHCGYVNKELTLRERTWICPDCGSALDRDLNAATNILRQGIASSGSPHKTKVTLRKGR